MPIIKKLAFTLFFFSSFARFIYYLLPFLKNEYLIFSFSTSDLVTFIYLLVFLSLTGWFFILFVTFAQSYLLVTPIVLLSGLIPIFLIPVPLNYIVAVGSTISFLFVYLLFRSELKTYLTFRPTVLIIPQVRHLTTLLILTACICYFYNSQIQILTHGFTIPDSLIDNVLQFSGVNNTAQTNSFPGIDQNTLDNLKDNPQILQQYGLDPSLLNKLSQADLNSLPSSNNNLKNNTVIKGQLKKQLNSLIDPYVRFIPFLMTVLLYFTLQPLASLLSSVFYPLTWLLFVVLNKAGFAKYTIEMREVKKLVV